MKKISVFGAGAIGSVLAARLARAGLEVSVVARPAHAAAIQAHGLRLAEPEGESIVKVTAAARVEELGVQDCVLVTLKAHSLPAAAADISRLANGAPIVFIVNGIPWWYAYGLSDAPERQLQRLDPQGLLWRHIDPAQVIGGVIKLPAELVAPGLVRWNGGNNQLELGEPSNLITPRLTEIVAALDGRCADVEATDDIRSAVWQKLLLNMPSSLIATLTQSLPRDALQDPEIESMYRRIIDEGLALARRVGANPRLNIEEQLRVSKQVRHPPSMLQDLLAGKTMEVDAQLGAACDLAERHDQEIPWIRTLTSLLVQRIAARDRAAN